jgi:hypothetical protein
MMRLAPRVTEQGIAEAGFGTAKAQSGMRQLPTTESANIAQQRFNQGQSEMGARLLSPLEEMTAAKYGLGKKEAESQGRLMVGAETAQDKINKSHELAAQGAIDARRLFGDLGVMLPFGDQKFKAASPEMIPFMRSATEFAQIPVEEQRRNDLTGSQLANELLGREATQQGMDIRGQQQGFLTTPVNVPGLGVLSPQMFEIMSQAQQMKDMADFRRDANMGQMLQSTMGAYTPEMAQVGMAMLRAKYPEVAKYLPQTAAAASGPSPAARSVAMQAVQDAVGGKGAVIGQQAPVNVPAAPTPQTPQTPVSNEESSIRRSLNTPIQSFDMYKQRQAPSMPPARSAKDLMDIPAPDITPPPAFDFNARPQPPYQGPMLQKPTTAVDPVQDYLSPMQPMMSTADVLAMIQQLLGQG